MRKFLLLMLGSLLLCLQLLAQNRTVTGRVTDANGNPVSGASVQVQNTRIGTVTKDDGTFSIGVPANRRTLVVSAVGQATQEVTIDNQTNLAVTLQAGNQQNLQEVVVVGYGTQRRRETTGNVASVSGGKVADKPVQSFEQALGGRAAGVQVSVANGIVNSPPVFRIRGTNSISLSSYPLIVVDGVPTYTGDVSSSYAASNPLSSINTNDIESIDIAKDAAATAIYGSRAANGVVFITTKKGKSGRAKISYNGWVSFSNAYRLPELLNASEYIGFKTSAVANNPTASAITYNSVNGPNGQPVDTRWYDYVYRQGVSQSHNVNVSGGNDNTSYYFSAGYTDQQGILRKNAFQRLNTLFNVDSRLSKIFSMGGKISFSNENNLAATTSGSLSGSAFNTGGLGRLAIVLPPIISPYNNDGSYNINGSAVGSSNITGISSLSYYNPVVPIDLSRSNSENNHIQTNVYAQLKPASWLTLRTQYGIDYLLVDNNIFQTPVSGDGYTNNGYAWSGSDKYKTWLWTNTAQFDYTFANVHNVSLLVGTEQQRRTSQSYGLQRQGLSDFSTNVIQAGYTTSNSADLGLGENYLYSNFGRLNYSLNKKYFLSGNVRQDEYSALGVKKGTFWGVSGGWELAKEDFWQGSALGNVFSSFRLRGSYGKVGNIAGIGDYTYYPALYGFGLYGGSSTLSFSSVGNNKLQWETSTKTDAGFSFGLFKDRITGEFAYYHNNIDHLILNVPQAPSAGLPSSVPLNVGTMYNKGVEITLNATPIQQKNFSWNTSFNVTFNKNMVTKLTEGLPYITTTTSSSETVNRTQAGYSLGYLWVVRTNGVDPATGKRIFVNSAGTNVYYQYYAPSGTYNYSTSPDGTVKYVSPTGATSISQASDAVMYANTQPRQYGGWDNTFRFGNFDLNALLTFQAGFYVYYGTNAGLHDQRWWENARDVLTDAWSKAGQTGAKYAKPIYGDNVSNGSAMPLDINVFKGDFIKLRSVTFGYTLPATVISRAKISSARLYVSGQNLAIMTKYPGPDPEVSSNGNTNTGQGVDRNTAANARTILVGLNIGF